MYSTSVHPSLNLTTMLTTDTLHNYTIESALAEVYPKSWVKRMCAKVSELNLEVSSQLNASIFNYLANFIGKFNDILRRNPRPCNPLRASARQSRTVCDADQWSSNVRGTETSLQDHTGTGDGRVTDLLDHNRNEHGNIQSISDNVCQVHSQEQTNSMVLGPSEQSTQREHNRQDSTYNQRAI